MRIRDYFVMAALGLATTVFGCSDDKKADVSPGDCKETAQLDVGDWFVVGSAPFARALKINGVDVPNSEVEFVEINGPVREASMYESSPGFYEGTLVVDGNSHAFTYDGGDFRFDYDADGVFEAADTLDLLLSRSESKPVFPGQHFLAHDGSAVVAYLGHDAGSAFFRDQWGQDYQVSLAQRADGALEGVFSFFNQDYSFALNADSSMTVDRDEDSHLEGFTADGLPSYFNAASRALSEGSGDTLTLGSVQYYVEPFLIDGSTARFVVNGEVTPALCEGDSYSLNARPAELRLHEVIDTPYGSKANFCLRAD